MRKNSQLSIAPRIMSGSLQQRSNLSFATNDYAEDSRKNHMPLSRKTQMSQYPYLGRFRVRTKFCFSIAGASGVLYFGNKKIILSLYQPQGSQTPFYAGLTNCSNNYVAYICYKAKFKLDISNVTSVPTLVSITARQGPAADGQTTLQKDPLLPQTKSVVLGSVVSSSANRILTQIVDATTLVGYDVTSSGISSFLTFFGSNPSTEVGSIINIESVDQVTVPNVVFTCHADYDIIGITQKPSY